MSAENDPWLNAHRTDYAAFRYALMDVMDATVEASGSITLKAALEITAAADAAHTKRITSKLPEQYISLLGDTTGEWVTYPGGDDAMTAFMLSQSIKDHPSWYSVSTEDEAAYVLAWGDVHVYFSRDEEGNNTIPRLLINRNGKDAIEVDGLDTRDRIEPHMMAVARLMFARIRGAQDHVGIASKILRMNHIQARWESGQDLDAYDLAFIYELNGPIYTFGRDDDGLPHDDQRPCNIRETRDLIADLEQIFPGDDHNTIVQKFVRNGPGWLLAQDIYLFTGLEHEAALALIEAGAGQYVVDELDAFENLIPWEIVMALVMNYHGPEILAENLSKFPGIDQEGAAYQLIMINKGDVVLDNLHNFSNVSHTWLAKTLVREGMTSEVLTALEHFTDLDQEEVVREFISVGADDIFTDYDLDLLTEISPETRRHLESKQKH